MKKLLLSLTIFALGLSTIFSQTILLDFEDPATSTTYQYFGSSLEGTLNNIIANPDMSGINTSAMVADHVKPEGAQVWAGAFPEPAMPVAADMIVNNQVCIKVWFNEPGNVGIKLEGSSTGGPNWIQTVDVTESMTWTEVCIDVSQPSLEDPFLPAAGHIYDVVTLFFDFGTSPTADRTYYWDDLVTVSGGGATEGDISFTVDMNDYAGTYTTVYVSGTFNNWSGDGNPLDDSDGDGVWTGTIADIPVGVQEYKFTVDNWTDQEQFNGYETCVITDASGEFTNRKLVVTGDAALPTYCFNSCYECGDAVNITFELGQGNIVLSPEGLFIAGGGNFGNPGDFPFNDDDGDGIWTATFERQKGFSSYHTFTNGACPDYSCKEDISGQDCADPNNFNDRFINPVMQDTTIATCFGECTTNTDCTGGVSPGNITFQVDMNNFSDPFTTPYVAGSFNGWAGDANPMVDPDGDGIWETTLLLNGGTYEYKFPLDNWTVDEVMTDGDPCTITDPSGQFVNRLLEVDGDATVCFEWSTCESCLSTGTDNLAFDATLFTVSPSIVSDYTTVYFNQDIPGAKTLRLISATGVVVQQLEIDATITEYRLSTNELAGGLFLIHVQSANRMATKKILKSGL